MVEYQTCLKIATKHYNLNNNGGYELRELFLNFTTKYKTIKDIHSVFYFKLKKYQGSLNIIYWHLKQFLSQPVEM